MQYRWEDVDGPPPGFNPQSPQKPLPLTLAQQQQLMASRGGGNAPMPGLAPSPFGSASDNLQSGTANFTTPPAQAMIPQGRTPGPPMQVGPAPQSPMGGLGGAKGWPGPVPYPAPQPPTPEAPEDWTQRGMPPFRNTMSSSAPGQNLTPPGAVEDDNPTDSAAPMPGVGGANLLSGGGLFAQREPFSPRPDAPTLQEAPVQDQDRRGMEKAALNSALFGLALGGGAGAVAGAVGGARGFNAENEADFRRKSLATTAANKSEIESYGKQVDQWTKEEGLKNTAFGTEVREGIGYANIEQHREAAAALIRVRNSELAARIKHFGALEKEAQRKTLVDMDQDITENGGALDAHGQTTIVTLRNRMAASMGYPEREVPGSLRGDGTRAPVLPKSAKVMNAESNRETAHANTLLAGGRLADIETNNKMKEREQNFKEKQEITNSAQEWEKIHNTQDHQKKMELIAQQNANTARRIAVLKESGGAPEADPKKIAAIEKRLQNAAGEIGAIRGKQAQAPPVRGKDEEEAPFKMRQDAYRLQQELLQQEAVQTREELELLAEQNGWEGNGSGGYRKKSYAPSRGLATPTQGQPGFEGGGPLTPMAIGAPDPKSAKYKGPGGEAAFNRDIAAYQARMRKGTGKPTAPKPAGKKALSEMSEKEINDAIIRRLQANNKA
jgi:hypothetical protein